jgi:prolyl oligopeptidase
MDAVNPDIADATEVVPEGDGAIAHNFYYKYSPNIVVTNDRIYVVYQNGGPNELVTYSLDGDRLESPQQAAVSAIYGLTAASNSDLVFATESYVSMPQWFRYRVGDSTTVQLGISSESPVDYSDVEVVREFATSEDGTRVPVNILMPRGARKDGSNPIVVTGYGGYGLSMSPGLSMSRHILFEHGVLFAQANLRGGGEYGEEWHLQGNLTNKQNVFDDFAAVIRHLVAEGYADPERVAIVGGSNGGLLMGATVAQHPDLAAAVVSHVGIYDMLRVELDPNGEFNVPEFGSVQDREQFEALYAYSPYHNINDGVDYPPILLPTGANDPRVNPAHSRKFSARLQAAQGGDGIVLLRTSSETGHGGGTPLDEVIELISDQYAFIFHHLGVPLDTS